MLIGIGVQKEVNLLDVIPLADILNLSMNVFRSIHWLTALALATLVVAAGSLSLWQQGHMLVCHGESHEALQQHAHGDECTHAHSYQTVRDDATAPCCRCRHPHQHDLASFVCVAARYRGFEFADGMTPLVDMPVGDCRMERYIQGHAPADVRRLLTLDFGLQCKRTVCLLV